MAIFELSIDDLKEELLSYKDNNIQPTDPYSKFLYLVYVKNTTKSMAISRVLMEDFNGQSFKSQDLFAQVCKQQASDIDFEISCRAKERAKKEREKNNDIDNG